MRPAIVAITLVLVLGAILPTDTDARFRRPHTAKRWGCTFSIEAGLEAGRRYRDLAAWARIRCRKPKRFAVNKIQFVQRRLYNPNFILNTTQFRPRDRDLYTWFRCVVPFRPRIYARAVFRRWGARERVIITTDELPVSGRPCRRA